MIQQTLFGETDTGRPLASRMRPRTLEEFEGQRHLLGEGKVLRQLIDGDRVPSMVFWGPPGVGKTTLARIIANRTKANFIDFSAVTSGIKEIKEVMQTAEANRRFGEQTILFVDEIHRFNRSQQDALLHAVENRTVVLVGATTENPFFEVNSALISRSRVVGLKGLSDGDVAQLVDRAVADPRGLDGLYTLDPAARSAIVLLAGGDGRASLTTLELAAGMQQPGTRENPAVITKAQVESATPHRALPYDKNKDMHYDIISAFIKSMRGSDPDAALYWLARMIDGGEDPKYIARRMLIHASEDVGNADPQALLVAAAAFKSAEVIGYPECRINLAQAATYIALAPKSNACEAGIDAALAEVRNGPKRDVPDYLRDRHRPGSEHYGVYKYPHDYPTGWVDQRYLPEGLERGCFYHPSERGWEAYRVDATARDRAQAVHAAARDRAQAPHAAAGVHHGVELPKARSVDVEANGVRSGRKKPGARDASEGEEAGAR